MSLHRIDALAGFVKILFVQLEAYEMPLFFDAGHGSRPAAHERVENGLTFVGAHVYQYLEEHFGLLAIMDIVALFVFVPLQWY